MKIDLEALDTGWSLLAISLRSQEIDSMIERLIGLKSGNFDHFHIHSTEFDVGPPSVADITISMLDSDEDENAVFG